MKQKQFYSIFVFFLVFGFLSMAFVPSLLAESEKIPQRSDIEDIYKWNVEDIFPNIAAWEVSFNYLKENLSRIESYKGKLAESSDNVLACIELSDSLDIIINNLYVYAYLKLDEDNRQSEFQELAGRVSSLNSQLSAAQSFIQPEILAIDPAKLESFINENKGLGLYRFYFEKQLRVREHILSAQEEAILAAAGQVLGAPSRIFAMIDDADHKLGTIVDKEGNKTELSRGRYYRIMEGSDRDMRRQANDTVQNSWMKYVNTLSATLGASIEKDLFLANMRGYKNCLESSLDASNIPSSVVYNLVETVNKNIDVLHKWTNLRKKVLGYDTLYTYDMSAPLTPEFDNEFTYDETKKMLLDGLNPMGTDYLADFDMGLKSGWVDVFETEGKGSGAYSWGTYTSHPYILMNFSGSLDDVFTLAHEMGHALNSFYTNKTEPYVYHNYSLFTAEVASTCNEAVLMKYMLKNAKSKNEKMALLNHYIKQIDGTFFTQVMFTEFELAIHERIEKGEAVSADYFRETYRNIFQKYYGPEMYISENNDMGGMKISHFYRQYYVFKYATSYAAAQMISQKIIEGDKEALKAYKKFLSTGSSLYPIDLLKTAGVDLTQPEAVERTIKLFGELVDELDKLLNEA